MSDVFIKSGFRVRSGHPIMGPAVSVSTAGITLVEDAPRFWRRLRVQLDNVVVPITAALDYGSVAILTLPDGLWWFAGSHANFSVTRDGTGIVAATDVNWALGSAAASNATLASLMLNLRDEETFSDNVLTDSVNTAQVATTTALAGQIIASTDSVFLNFSATLSADGSMTVNGTIDLFALNFQGP